MATNAELRELCRELQRIQQALLQDPAQEQERIAKTALLNKVADLARDDATVRVLLGDAFLPAAVHSFRSTFTALQLAESSRSLDEETGVEVAQLHASLRALGNLLADSDDNRHLLLEKGKDTTERLQKLLGNHGQIAHKAVAVLLNFSMDFEPAQDFLQSQGLVQALAERLKAKPEDVGHIFTLLDNLLETESGCQQLAETKLVEFMAEHLTLFKSEGIEYLESLVSMEWAAILFTEKAIDGMIAHVTSRLASPSPLTPEMNKELQRLGMVVSTVASIDDLLPIFSRPSLLMHLREKWLDQSVSSSVQVAAILTIGNTARTDSNCLMLAEGGFIGQLLRYYRQSHDNISFQTTILMTLKNLSIPPSTKPYFNQENTILTIAPSIQRLTVPEIAMSALGIIKNLLRNDVDNGTLVTRTLVPDMDEMTTAKLIYSTVTKCDHEGAVAEGTRALVNIVKTRNADSIKVLAEMGVVGPFVKLLLSKHMLLKMDGMIGLALLGAEGRLHPYLMAHRDLTKKMCTELRAILENPELQSPLISNACVLIRELIQEGISKAEEWRFTMDAVRQSAEQELQQFNAEEDFEEREGWKSVVEASKSVLSLK